MPLYRLLMLRRQDLAAARFGQIVEILGVVGRDQFQRVSLVFSIWKKRGERVIQARL